MKNDMKPKELTCDLAVIGTGMAGIAGAVFAANRGLSVVQVGKASEISFSSGCLDLFAHIPGPTLQRFSDPLEGIRELSIQQPLHPYAGLDPEEILRGFHEFIEFMASAGIEYTCLETGNQRIITPAGILKPTFCVPAAMSAGSAAVEKKLPLLIADIKGLKGFGALQMARTLATQDPGLPPIRTATIAFPGREEAGDLMCERLTWDLETPGILEQFARRLAPHAKDVEVVGLPAILGIYRFEELRGELERILGKQVFEIPTLAPSVTGMRTKEAFLGQLPGMDIRHFPVSVQTVDVSGKGFSFRVSQGLDTRQVKARALLLATGRFLGRGLGVENNRVKEMLLDLPVSQTDTRNQWLSRDFFDTRGHAVNRAGIETDDRFRPLGRDGKVFHEKLYAAGAILAHQDWKREKSGAGISIASAFTAVTHLAG